ncbi:MAG: hypothetical protein Q8L86_00770 [Vicinamibacterales bacterium]|nr:hypothetical protein [Vicinamibacterales bacterium]
MLQPALLGGVTIGVLSALPIVNLVNLCCCAWIVAGGSVSSYLLQQQRPTPITAGDGALVGVMAGAVGAVVWLVIEIPLSFALAPLQQSLVESMLQNSADLPPGMQAWMEGLRSGAARGAGIVFQFLLMLIVGSLFAMAGGIIGALAFRKSTPPPVPAEWTPPPPLPPQ